MTEILYLEREVRRLRQIDKIIEGCRTTLSNLSSSETADELRLQVLVEESLDVWRRTRRIVVEDIELKVKRFLKGRGVETYIRGLKRVNLSAAP